MGQGGKQIQQQCNIHYTTEYTALISKVFSAQVVQYYDSYSYFSAFQNFFVVFRDQKPVPSLIFPCLFRLNVCNKQKINLVLTMTWLSIKKLKYYSKLCINKDKVWFNWILVSCVTILEYFFKVCEPWTGRPLANVWDVNHWIALRRQVRFSQLFGSENTSALLPSPTQGELPETHPGDSILANKSRVGFK